MTRLNTPEHHNQQRQKQIVIIYRLQSCQVTRHPQFSKAAPFQKDIIIIIIIFLEHGALITRGGMEAQLHALLSSH